MILFTNEELQNLHTKKQAMALVSRKETELNRMSENSIEGETEQTKQQLDMFCSLKEVLEKVVDEEEDISFLVKTFNTAVDKGKISSAFLEDMSAALCGIDIAARNTIHRLDDIADYETKRRWYKYFCDIGITAFYDAYALLCFSKNPDEAIRWFAKAEATGQITSFGYAYWGKIYAERKMYAKAAEKFQKGVDSGTDGTDEAMVLLGAMYEEGLTGRVDLTKAMELYQASYAMGNQMALEGIRSVNKTLNAANNQASRSMPPQGNQQPHTQNPNSADVRQLAASSAPQGGRSQENIQNSTNTDSESENTTRVTVILAVAGVIILLLFLTNVL